MRVGHIGRHEDRDHSPRGGYLDHNCTQRIDDPTLGGHDLDQPPPSFHDSSRAPRAHAFVLSQRLDRGVCRPQREAERNCIFYRLSSALTGMWKHGVGGVTE